MANNHTYKTAEIIFVSTQWNALADLRNLCYMSSFNFVKESIRVNQPQYQTISAQCLLTELTGEMYVRILEVGFIIQLEIRSMERGICPIAVL